jgi:hypothetical protein
MTPTELEELRQASASLPEWQRDAAQQRPAISEIGDTSPSGAGPTGLPAGYTPPRPEDFEIKIPAEDYADLMKQLRTPPAPPPLPSVEQSTPQSIRLSPPPPDAPQGQPGVLHTGPQPFTFSGPGPSLSPVDMPQPERPSFSSMLSGTVSELGNLMEGGGKLDKPPDSNMEDLLDRLEDLTDQIRRLADLMERGDRGSSRAEAPERVQPHGPEEQKAEREASPKRKRVPQSFRE